MEKEGWRGASCSKVSGVKRVKERACFVKLEGLQPVRFRSETESYKRRLYLGANEFAEIGKIYSEDE